MKTVTWKSQLAIGIVQNTRSRQIYISNLMHLLSGQWLHGTSVSFRTPVVITHAISKVK
jgi:hypothetical protein